MKNLLAGALLAVVLISGGYYGWQYYQNQHTLTVTFANAKGLQPGAEIWMNGVMIGEVRDIILTPNGVDTILYIRKQHWPGLTEHALFVIDPSAGNGLTVLRIKKGKPGGKPVEPQQHLRGIDSLILWNMSEFPIRMEHLLNSPSIRQIINDFARIQQEVGEIIKNMDFNAIGDQLENDMRRFSEDINQAINSGQLQQKFNEITARIERLKLTLSQIGASEEVKQLIKSLEELRQQIEQKISE